MPLRSSRVDALELIAYSDGIATLDLLVSSGTYVRSIADALGGHCAALRRTEVGPFGVGEADAERVLPLDEALGRIGLTVAEADAERSRKAARRQGTSGRVRPDEDRAFAVPARAPAAGCRDGNVRRRAPRAQERHPRGDRLRARRNGDHLRPAPADRPRQQRRADHDARAPARALRRGRGGDDARGLVHARADGTRARGVRRAVPPRRSGPRRSRRGWISALARVAGAISSCSRDSASRCSRSRWSKVSRPPRSVTPSRRARSGPQRRCSAAPTSSTASSSPATSAAARSGIRPRTWRSARSSRARATASTQARPWAIARQSRSGRIPHYGGTERRIEPYLLDFEGDLYGKRLVVEVWERLRDEAVFATEADLVAQIGRDVDATRAAVRPATAA